MSFTYDTSNNIGKVRAITGDVTQSSAVLSDEQITVFLNLLSSDILKTSAMCMRTIAASKALIAKYKAAGNYSEDTRQMAKDLLAVANDLDEAANAMPADAQAEIIVNDFSFRNILQNRVMRGESLDD